MSDSFCVKCVFKKLKVLVAEMGLTIKALLLMCVERLREGKEMDK